MKPDPKPNPKTDDQSIDATFLRIPAAVKLSGLSRSHLYALCKEGKIRSSVLKQRNALRGVRLIHRDSLVAFIERAGQGEHPSEQPPKIKPIIWLTPELAGLPETETPPPATSFESEVITLIRSRLSAGIVPSEWEFNLVMRGVQGVIPTPNRNETPPKYHENDSQRQCSRR